MCKRVDLRFLCLLLGLLYFSACPTLIWWLPFYLIIFCCYLLEASFLMADREGVDPDGRGRGEELGGAEEGKIVFNLY